MRLSSFNCFHFQMMSQQSKRDRIDSNILISFLYVFIYFSFKEIDDFYKGTARGILGAEERAVRNAMDMWRKGEAGGQNIPIEHLLLVQE